MLSLWRTARLAGSVGRMRLEGIWERGAGVYGGALRASRAGWAVWCGPYVRVFWGGRGWHRRPVRRLAGLRSCRQCLEKRRTVGLIESGPYGGVGEVQEAGHCGGGAWRADGACEPRCENEEGPRERVVCLAGPFELTSGGRWQIEADCVGTQRKEGENGGGKEGRKTGPVRVATRVTWRSRVVVGRGVEGV